MNAIQVIRPYKYYGTWVFSDERTGLLREPFVFGMSEMITEMVKDIFGAEFGFLMWFSKSPPPVENYYLLKLMAEEMNGGWYREVFTRMCGWLCPATLLYFDDLPEELYVWAEYLAPEYQVQVDKNGRGGIHAGPKAVGRL